MGRRSKSIVFTPFTPSYSCPYADCTFTCASADDMIEHKSLDHEGYCILCNVDCDDLAALLQHKMASDQHICCRTCGKDFRSDSGKRFHEDKMHPPLVSITCIGCKSLFESGASYMSHVYENECSSACDLVCRDTLHRFRARASLHLDSLACEMKRPETWQTTTYSIIDDDDEDTESTMGVSLNELYRPLQNSAIAIAPSGGKEQPDECREPADPVKAQTAAKDTMPHSTTKSPHARASPFNNEYSLKHPVTSSSANFKPRMQSDWTDYVFERDATGELTCPFESCTQRGLSETSMLNHLQSGFHFGTDFTCNRCLKVFRDDKIVRGNNHSRHRSAPLVRLLAHMESSGSRCSIHKTAKYDNIIHALTGGFLHVCRDKTGKTFLQATEKPDPCGPTYDFNAYQN